VNAARVWRSAALLLALMAQALSPSIAAAGLGDGDDAASETKEKPPRMSPAELRARRVKDRRWLSFGLEGAQGRIGLTVAPGLIKTHDPDDGWSSSYLTFMVAFNVAVLLGRTEVGLELAPVPFGVNVFVGRYLPLYNRPGATVRVFWPLRGGLGFTGVEPLHLQARADFVGVAFLVGHLLFELSLPSLRYHTEFDPAQHHLSWLFGASCSYVF
jgi:hypothetical protein